MSKNPLLSKTARYHYKLINVNLTKPAHYAKLNCIYFYLKYVFVIKRFDTGHFQVSNELNRPQ